MTPRLTSMMDHSPAFACIQVKIRVVLQSLHVDEADYRSHDGSGLFMTN